MINEKGGYLEVLKNKLDKARKQIKILDYKFKRQRRINRELRKSLEQKK